MSKRYFKLLTLIMVSILMLIVLTACGDSKSSDSDISIADESKDSPEDSAPEPGEKITLSIGTSVYVEAPHRKAIDGLIEAYNQKNPNVQIEIFGAGYDNFWDNLTTEILGNNEGDIIQMYPENISRFHSLKPEGTFVELTSYMDGKGFQEKLVGQEFCEFDGEELALSNYAWGTTGMFYRKSMLEEAGIDPNSIKTQEDFRDACIKLAEGENTALGVVLGTHPFVVSEWSRLISRPVSNGTYFKDGETGPYTADRVNVNAPENIWAAQWWQDFLIKDGVAKLVPDKKDSRELFWNGNAAFNLDGPWFIGMTQERDASLMDDIGIIPQFDIEYNNEMYKPNPTMYPLVSVISKNCEHPEAAWEFLEWMTSEEAQKIIEVCGMIPSNKDYSTSQAYIDGHDIEYKFVEFIENNYTNLVSDPPIPQQGEIQQVMIDATQAMFSEKSADVKTEMDKAQEKIVEIINQ